MNPLSSTTNVLNPDGKVVSIPHEQLSDALQNGYQLPTSEEIEHAKVQQQYGEGIVNPALAFGAGALRGASLSASDVAMTKTGLINPETLKGLSEANPGLSLTGEGAGAIGAMLYGNEAGPVPLIGKLGKATYEGAKAIKFMKLAQEGTQAARVLGATGDIAAHALGSAVEGAAFSGIGNTLNEYALGDPDLNSEKIMGNIGKGALWGGALGTALKAASIATPLSVKAARSGLETIRNTLIGTGEEGSSGLVGRLAPESKFTEALGHRMTNLDVNQQTELLNKATSELNEVHSNTQTALKDLNQSLRPQEIDALIDTADPNKVAIATQDVIDQMNIQMAYMKKNPGLFNTQAVAKLNQWHSQLTNNLESQDLADRFNVLKDVKQGLGNWGHGILDATKGDTKQVLTGLSSFISDKLKDPDIFGFVGSNYAKHDEMLHDVYQFIHPNGKPTQRLSGLMTNVGTRTKPNFQFDSTKVGRMFKSSESTGGQAKLEALNDYFDTLKKLPDHLENTHANVPNDVSFDQSELSNMLENHQQSIGEAGQKYLEAIKNQKGSLGLRDMLAASIGFTHPVVGAAMEAYNIAKHPFTYMNSLAEVERMAGKATDALGKGADSVFVPTIKTLGRAKGAISSEASRTNVAQHQESSRQMAQLTSDPTHLIDQLNGATKELYDVAPQTAQSMQASMLRALQFLQSKIPTKNNNNPFEAEYEPSAMELSQYNRYLSVVEKPSIAFEQMNKGILGPETIETLSTVYPKLYDHMKQVLLSKATDRLQKGETIPFKVKQQMSFFLGQPVDSSFNPQAVTANQVAYQMNQQAQNQPKPSTKGMTKLNVASRSKVHQQVDT